MVEERGAGKKPTSQLLKCDTLREGWIKGMRFQQKKRLLRLLGVLLCLGLVAVYVTKSAGMSRVAIVLVLGYLALWLWLWRCPFCGKHLGYGAGTHCPNCGENIEEA